MSSTFDFILTIEKTDKNRRIFNILDRYIIPFFSAKVWQMYLIDFIQFFLKVQVVKAVKIRRLPVKGARPCIAKILSKIITSPCCQGKATV